MATLYDEYTITTANNSSFSSSSDTMGYYCTNPCEMSREDMPKTKKKKQSKKKDHKFKSEIMNWTMKHLKFGLNDICVLFHSPMYTRRSSELLNDFQPLPMLGYVAQTVPAHDYIEHVAFADRGRFTNFTKIFVDGVLEHMPGIMAQALLLKKLMARLHPERPGYLILRTNTREQIRKEAERNNYPKDGKGYLVTLPGGQQSRIEGIDEEELRTIIAYGRIGSIRKSDISSKIKGSYIIIWNGA